MRRSHRTGALALVKFPPLKTCLDIVKNISDDTVTSDDFITGLHSQSELDPLIKNYDFEWGQAREALSNFLDLIRDYLNEFYIEYEITRLIPKIKTGLLVSKKMQGKWQNYSEFVGSYYKKIQAKYGIEDWKIGDTGKSKISRVNRLASGDPFRATPGLGRTSMSKLTLPLGILFFPL
jgi:hypothetical protein